MGQVLSVAFDKNIKMFDLYDNLVGSWQDRESIFTISPDVKIHNSTYLTFEEIEKINNIIFLSCNTKKDEELMQDRNKYIKTKNQDYDLFDLRIRYHRELYNFLVKQGKDFFEIEFSHIWNRNLFLQRMEELKKIFNIDISKDVLQILHKKWTMSNLKIKQNKELRWQ